MQRLHRLFSTLPPGRHALFAAVLAVLLTIPSLWIGFVTDDHVFRLIFQRAPSLPELKIPLLDTFSFGKGEPAYNIQLMERGVVPWWTDPQWQLAFWRPLASMTHWVDHTLFGSWAWPMHLHSMLLYAILCYLVARLYQRHIPLAWVAGLASFLYAVDSAHALPVGWLANRNAILAAIFGVATLIGHDHWRSKRGWLSGVTSSGLFVLALLCGEGSIAVVGYLFAYACFMESARRRSRAISLLPYVVIVMLWRLLYGSMGYGAAGSGLYTDPGHDPASFFLSLITYLPMLIYSHFAGPDPVVWSFTPEPWNWLYLGFAMAVLAILIVAMWPLLLTSAVARFYGLGMVLSAIPACATIPQYRLLMFAGIGGMGLIALFLGAWPQHASGLSRYRRHLAAVLCVLHVVVSPIMFPVSLFGLKMLGTAFNRTNESLPTDPGVVEDTVVIVSTTGDLTYAIPPAMRSSLGQPMPKNLWPLYSGVHDATITRTGAATLEMEVPEGWLRRPWAMLFRDVRSNPIPKGYDVALKEMNVTVLDLNGEGYPSRVRFEFDTPIHESSFRWYTWGGGYFVPFELPAIGESRVLPGTGLRGILREIMGKLQ